MPKKVKICQNCKRPLVGEKAEVCPLCKKVFCIYHATPEEHKCERVDWAGMEAEKQEFEEKRWDKFKEVVKRENEERFWKNITHKIGWLIIILVVLAIIAKWQGYI